MKVLVIGGTKFVGRATTEALLLGGHEVTHFNRGVSGPGVFPDVETVLGDRFEDLGRLGDRTWDAVIDTCGYVPRALEASCDALGTKVGRYLFVSTMSVYPNGEPKRKEDSELLPAVTDTEEVTAETYGGLKVACEEVVRRRLGGSATVVRPGLIVGPHDHTERFTYWPVRFADGGEVLVPDCPDRDITALDVRDLAAFMVGLLERDWAGTVNADRASTTWGDLVRGGQSSWEFDPVWVDETFIIEGGIGYWSGLPVFIPEDFSLGDLTLAESLGLRSRGIEETLRDTLADARSKGLKRPLKAGPGAATEQELIRKWKESIGN